MEEPATDETAHEDEITQEEAPQEEIRCSNCGAVVTGTYCSECGQEQKEGVVSLRLMAEDVVDNFITFDARIPRTLKPLLLKPGFLTNEYLKGRRERYTRPTRLYLAISILFFFVLSLTSGGSISNFSFGDDAAVADTVQARYDSLYAEAGQALSAAFAPPVEVDVDGTAIELNDDSSDVELRLVRETEEEMETEVVSLFVDNLPKMMFLMLPVFALLLKLLYIRRHRYYIEHLIFALHYHSFVFITLLLITLSLQLLPVVFSSLLGTGLGIGLFVYLYGAMRTVYGQSWIKTGLKFLLLLMIYFFVLIVGITLNAILIMWQMGTFEMVTF